VFLNGNQHTKGHFVPLRWE